MQTQTQIDLMQKTSNEIFFLRSPTDIQLFTRSKHCTDPKTVNNVYGFINGKKNWDEAVLLLALGLAFKSKSLIHLNLSNPMGGIADYEWLVEDLVDYYQAHVQNLPDSGQYYRGKDSINMCSKALEHIAKEYLEFVENTPLVTTQIIKKWVVKNKANLAHMNLAGWNLSGIDLSGADLTKTSFRNCNLTDANLDGANLTNTNLSSTDFTDASLQGADLTGAVMPNACLNGANLTNAVMVNTHQSKVNGFNAVMKGVNLDQAYMYNAVYDEADFSDAIFANAKIIDSSFVDANFNGTELSDYDRSNDDRLTYGMANG